MAKSKEFLKKKIANLLEENLDEGGLADAYGYGAFMESMIVDLIPYLNREGLLLFESELESAFEEELRTGQTIRM